MKDSRRLIFDPEDGSLRTAFDPPLTYAELVALAAAACAKAVEEHDAPPERSVVMMPAIFLERVLTDTRHAQERHQAVLERCTELKLENRALRDVIQGAVEAEAPPSPEVLAACPNLRRAPPVKPEPKPSTPPPHVQGVPPENACKFCGQYTTTGYCSQQCAARSGAA